MYPYLENYANPKNDYKVYFTGKIPLEEKPPAAPPAKVEPAKPVSVASEDKLRFLVNDGGLVQPRRIALGEVVAMSYNNKILLVTPNEKGDLLII